MTEVKTRGSAWGYGIALAIGLALLNVWSDTIGHNPALNVSNDAVQAVFVNSRVFFSSGLTTSMILFALFPTQVARLDKPLLIVMPLFGAASTALYSFCTVQSVLPASVAGLIGAFGTGFGYGYLEIRILSQTARIKGYPIMIAVLTASFILKTIATAVLGTCSDGFQIVTTILTPILTAVTLPLIQNIFKREGVTSDIARLPRFGSVERSTMLIFLILGSSLSAVARALSTLGFWGNGNNIDAGYFPGIPLGIIVFIAAVYFTYVFLGDRFKITDRLTVAFLVLLAAFLFLQQQEVSTLANEDSALVQFFVIVAELYSHMIFWVVTIVAIRNLDIHPYRLVGFGEGSMSLSAVILALSLSSLSGFMKDMIAISMYAVIIVVFLLFRRASHGSSSAPMTETDSADKAFDLIAEKYGLSAREKDVFVMLAQGRSRSFIMEQLYLSDSTVKTHTQHVYQKLDVHSKQELITLIQDFRNRS